MQENVMFPTATPSEIFQFLAEMKLNHKSKE
jgi:hypothetical protein